MRPLTKHNQEFFRFIGRDSGLEPVIAWSEVRVLLGPLEKIASDPETA
jgi:hypothetical protein